MGEARAWWDTQLKDDQPKWLVWCYSTLNTALTSKDFERVSARHLKSRLRPFLGRESRGNWHRPSHDTGIRLRTVLGVVVRAMANMVSYLLLKNPRRFTAWECQEIGKDKTNKCSYSNPINS